MATWGELEKAGTKWRDHEEMTWGKLEEFCVINPKTKQIPDDMEVSFVPMQSVSETGDVQTDEVRKASEVKKGFTFFEEGDVLFAKITPCMENGKGGIARGLKNGVGFGSTEFHVLHPDPEKVSSEWLYYLTSWDEFRKQCARNMTGSAGQKRVPKSYLEHYKVHLPPLEEQRRIAALLDKVSDLIAKRRAQLDKLDLLVKARFVEMFGDPVINPYSWNVSALSELGECKNGMNFHTDDSGAVIHCLGVGDFKDLSLIEDTSKLPTISLNEMPSEDYLLANGDIVFVRSNGNKALVGRSVAVYPNDIPTTFSGFCIRFRIQNPVILPSYLLRVLKTDSMRKKMAGRGANIQNLNQKILAELRIPIPGLALQEEYELFIKKVDKSKLTIQRSFDKLEILKKALMQQYFG